MNIDWSCPMTILTPYGNTLLLNQDVGGGRQYKLNPRRCVGRREIVQTTEQIPQGDGEVFHDRFASGSEMQLAIQLWENASAIACDDVLVDMYDDLRGIFWELLRHPTEDGGRITWTPAGKDARLLDAIRLQRLEDPDEDAETGATEILVVVDSPFPYAVSEAETVVVLSGTVALPNDGNVLFYPVFKVNGATSAFTITNNDTGLEYVYSGAAIGGGEYAEIDMFRGGIIYLNGNQDNLKAGIDVLASDILYIEPGGNSFTITGASADVLTHAAFA